MWLVICKASICGTDTATTTHRLFVSTIAVKEKTYIKNYMIFIVPWSQDGHKSSDKKGVLLHSTEI